ncbi:MAG: HYR domain-containing protein, partial [Nitrososphaerales archaeon]
ASGDSFSIGTTAVNCTSQDKAGNITTGSFNVLVYPFIQFADPNTIYGKPAYPLNKKATLTIVDPAVASADIISAFLKSTTSTISAESDDLIASLDKKVGGVPGEFEGLILLSEAFNGAVSNVLYVASDDTVTASYDTDTGPSTATTEVGPEAGEGSGVDASGLATVVLRWSNDIVPMESRITIKAVPGTSFCTGFSTTNIDTYNVKVVASGAGADTTGFTIKLKEDTGSSCTFSSNPMLKITAGSTISNIATSGYPALQSVVNNIVTVTTASSGLNAATLLPIPIPSSTPLSLVALTSTDSVPCGTGNDPDSDGLCTAWETSTGLVIPYGTATYTYGCSKLVDDPSPTPNDSTNPINGARNNLLVCPDPNVKDMYVE